VPEVNFYMKGGIEEIQESAGDGKKGQETKKPEAAKKSEEKRV